MIDKWRKTFEILGKPLQFYALALVCIATILGLIIKSDLKPEHKFTCIKYGGGLGLIIIVIVIYFSIFRPKPLVFDQSGHLEEARMRDSDSSASAETTSSTDIESISNNNSSESNSINSNNQE
jgi:hypothetical protein